MYSWLVFGVILIQDGRPSGSNLGNTKMAMTVNFTVVFKVSVVVAETYHCERSFHIECNLNCFKESCRAEGLTKDHVLVKDASERNKSSNSKI